MVVIQISISYVSLVRIVIYYTSITLISGAMVAILRGGGCSFGIKVLNAQKLGAKAVVILNTDDKKSMRLMAQPDEVPLINITCIMVFPIHRVSLLMGSHVLFL